MANSNKIKVARSTTRANLPTLDYGEVAYVKNQELLVGNGDGTDFVVNDYSNLTNKPTLLSAADVAAQIVAANPKFVNINPITENTQFFLQMTNAQAVRFDVLLRSVDNHNVELRSAYVVIDGNDGIAWTQFSSGSIGDTSAIQLVFTSDQSKLSLGFDVSAGSWNVSVTPYPTTFASSGPGVYTTFGV
jgi:hypothetical protein